MNTTGSQQPEPESGRSPPLCAPATGEAGVSAAPAKNDVEGHERGDSEGMGAASHSLRAMDVLSGLRNGGVAVAERRGSNCRTAG